MMGVKRGAVGERGVHVFEERGISRKGDEKRKGVLIHLFYGNCESHYSKFNRAQFQGLRVLQSQH